MLPIQCATCDHFIKPDPASPKVTCKAFPDGIPEKIFTGEVDHDRPVEGQVGRFVWKEKRSRTARGHRTWFAVRCDSCGETFFFSRPRRSWTRFTMPGHGPGTPCGNRHLRILHYGERLKALKAAGKI